MHFKCKKAIIGGTFDHFHKGHKFFIDNAFKNSEFVTIGITNQNFSKDKKFSYSIESYSARRKSLISYLKEKDYSKRSKLIKISDVYGTSLTDPNLNVIFVGDDGFKNALKINRNRKELGFSTLQIIKNDYVKDSHRKILSSTRIREGLINREGKVYFDKFSKARELFLPLKVREKLRKPYGKIKKKISKDKYENKFIIAVGDIVVSDLIKKGITPNVCIFDLKTWRKEITNQNILKFIPKEDLTVKNIQGTIMHEAVKIIGKAIEKSLKNNKSYKIKIIGEEDLLALPAILLSPLNAIVIYGLRGKGAVLAKVSEKLKKNVSQVVSEFTFKT